MASSGGRGRVVFMRPKFGFGGNVAAISSSLSTDRSSSSETLS